MVAVTDTVAAVEIAALVESGVTTV